MMKTLRLLPLLALAALASSCSYDFELDDMNATEKLVLYCMPCADRDTTLIQLYRSRPVTPKGIADRPLTDIRIAFSVNGEEQAVHYAETSLPTVPAGCYYVLGRWNEADRIHLRAEADGLPAVHAETTVPVSVPLRQVEMKQKREASKKLQFRITFRDDATTSDYYGLRIVKRTLYRNIIDDSVIRTTDDALLLETGDEPLLNDKTGLNATIDLPESFYQNLYIWNDRKIQGREYTLRLSTYYTMDYASIWDYNEGYSSSYATLYKVYLYRFSPEMYHYLKSLNDIRNNELGSKGLADIRCSYTNVANGIGVLGSCRMAETGWMQNLPDEEAVEPTMEWSSDDVTLQPLENSSDFLIRFPSEGGTFTLRNLTTGTCHFNMFNWASVESSDEVQNAWFHAVVREDTLRLTLQPNDTETKRTTSAYITSGDRRLVNGFLFVQSGAQRLPQTTAKRRLVQKETACLVTR